MIDTIEKFEHCFLLSKMTLFCLFRTIMACQNQDLPVLLFFWQLFERHLTS